MMNPKLSFDSSSLMTSSSSTFSSQRASSSVLQRYQSGAGDPFAFEMSGDLAPACGLRESRASFVEQASFQRTVQQKITKIRKTIRIVNGQVVEEEEVVDEIEQEPQIDHFTSGRRLDFSQQAFATLDNNGQFNSDFKKFAGFDSMLKPRRNYDKQLKLCSAENETKAIDTAPINSDNKPSKILKALGFTKTKDNVKANLIINELMTTEENYVKDLCWIVENYLPELDRPDAPEELKGYKKYMLFGNIEIICMFHDVQFLTDLRECEKTPDDVAKCFLKHAKEFYLYRHYNRNKPYTERNLQKYGNFFKEKESQLKDLMDLSSYLIKPTQRLGKYILLLKELAKECKKQKMQSCNINEAVEMLEAEMRLGNDLMALDAIKGCEINLKDQGDLIYRNKFTVWPDVGSKYEAMVFLFSKLMLFTNIKLEHHVDVHYYQDNIRIADIGLTVCEKEPKVFKVWYMNHKEKQYKLQTKCEKTKEQWVKEIRKQLQQQLEMAKTSTRNKPKGYIDLSRTKYMDGNARNSSGS